MAVTELKRWTAILILVGMVMTIGGSWAVTRNGVTQNREDLADFREEQGIVRDILEQQIESVAEEVDCADDVIDDIGADVAVIKADIRWLCVAVDDLSD